MKEIQEQKVTRIDITVQGNSKAEVLKAISDELDKNPDLYSFNGRFFGFLKGTPISSSEACRSAYHYPRAQIISESKPKITLNISTLIGKIEVKVPHIESKNPSEEYLESLERLSIEVREAVLSTILNAIRDSTLTKF